MTDLNYEEMMGQAKMEASRRDVVSIAKDLRNGNMGLNVQPVSNGFIVSVGYDSTVVCVRANDVGLLIRTLYSSDLDNEQALRRLRRLMGYK